MGVEKNNLLEWLSIYQKAYLVADTEKISQILAQLISQLQIAAPELMRASNEEKLVEIFTLLLEAMERKDYVQIQDVLETKIQPLLFDENQ